MSAWKRSEDELPREETPVLIFRDGEICPGELRWETTSYEETYVPFRYWDDPTNDGRDWDWYSVTHWMSLPEMPK